MWVCIQHHTISLVNLSISEFQGLTLRIINVFFYRSKYLQYFSSCPFSSKCSLANNINRDPYFQKTPLFELGWHRIFNLVLYKFSLSIFFFRKKYVLISSRSILQSLKLFCEKNTKQNVAQILLDFLFYFIQSANWHNSASSDQKMGKQCVAYIINGERHSFYTANWIGT